MAPPATCPTPPALQAQFEVWLAAKQRLAQIKARKRGKDAKPLQAQGATWQGPTQPDSAQKVSLVRPHQQLLKHLPCGNSVCTQLQGTHFACLPSWVQAFQEVAERLMAQGQQGSLTERQLQEQQEDMWQVRHFPVAGDRAGACALLRRGALSFRGL